MTMKCNNSVSVRLLLYWNDCARVAVWRLCLLVLWYNVCATHTEVHTETERFALGNLGIWKLWTGARWNPPRWRTGLDVMCACSAKKKKEKRKKQTVGWWSINCWSRKSASSPSVARGHEKTIKNTTWDQGWAETHQWFYSMLPKNVRVTSFTLKGRSCCRCRCLREINNSRPNLEGNKSPTCICGTWPKDN